jgi:hypothetical protein
MSWKGEFLNIWTKDRNITYLVGREAIMELNDPNQVSTLTFCVPCLLEYEIGTRLCHFIPNDIHCVASLESSWSIGTKLHRNYLNCLI